MPNPALPDTSLQYIFPAHLIASEIIALGVRKLTFRLDKPFSFQPWQYVWVEIPHLDITDIRGNRRAFSIFNTPNSKNTIQIIARISNSGYKQTLFSLDLGREVLIHGPFGSSFMIDDQSTQNIFMIAGGLGVVSFIRLIETIRDRYYPLRCFLLYLNHDQASTPFLKELADLKQQNSFFDYQVKYEHFTLADIEEPRRHLGDNPRWWITGPQGLVNHAHQILVQAGISRPDMEFENFYPSQKNHLTQEMLLSQLQGQNLFANAIQNSTNHTIITDPNGVVLFANQAAQRITGYTETEMLGNTPRLWGGLMSRQFYLDFWHKKTAGEAIESEIINRRKNGEIYHALAHIAPIFGENQEIIGHIGTEEDITDRVEAERKLAESQKFLNSVVENLPTMVFVKDARDLKFTLFNKAGEELLGLSREEMLGKSDHDFFPQEQAESFVVKDREVIASKEPRDIPEEPIQTKNKGQRILHTRKIPIMDSQDQPQYLLGVSEDITELKENQRKIEAKNKELTQLNTAMIGRELKMIELKKIIAELQKGVSHD